MITEVDLSCLLASLESDVEMIILLCGFVSLFVDRQCYKIQQMEKEIRTCYIMAQ